MTLNKKFFGTVPGTLEDRLTWKIYDRDTRRKLSDDYGSEVGDLYYDNFFVSSMVLKETKNGKQYIRVTVYQPA